MQGASNQIQSILRLILSTSEHITCFNQLLGYQRHLDGVVIKSWAIHRLTIKSRFVLVLENQGLNFAQIKLQSPLRPLKISKVFILF